MQEKLNTLSCYCRKKHLGVNINKLKILMFSEGRPKKKKVFLNNNKCIKFVPEIIYLGIRIIKSGVFLKATKQRVSKGNDVSKTVRELCANHIAKTDFLKIDSVKLC